MVLFLFFITAGCAHHHHKSKHKAAPIVNGWQRATAAHSAYVVQKGDTLYSIAWAFDLDYRELAKINDIKSPYALRAGQHLLIKKSGCAPSPRYAKKTAPIDSTVYKKVGNWLWPASGKIIFKFDSDAGKKGIDIAGAADTPIIASAAGKVVYSGSGIRSYGNLIIIKHNDDYLSAYAYNKTMLVKEGQMVSSGQKIATMGRTDAGVAQLHFEIRHIGKPVDPLLLLPKK
jgi:lipoprotein NlpD